MNDEGDLDGDRTAVITAVRDYDRCLVAGDHAAAAAWFAPSDHTSRFGQDGEQLGWPAIADARAATGPTVEATWVYESCRRLGPDAFVHTGLLQRGERLVRRTQVWCLTDDRWQITHAHVSHRDGDRS